MSNGAEAPTQDPCAVLNSAPTRVAEPDGGVPKGAKTSDYYRTTNLPDRFEQPVIGVTPGNPVFTCNKDSMGSDPQTTPDADRFKGYPTKQASAMYRTSNSDYGSKRPNIHTVPCVFHAKSQEFSNHLGVCGMYRNHSLNCSSDKSVVPDH